MVRGAFKSRSRKRMQVRIPSGKSVLRFREDRPGKATCPTGRPLPGTARGTANDLAKLRKTERRPSRPYGGVLSSPALRSVMQARVQEQFAPPEKAAGNYAVGAVCMKIAGRDAGKLCVITEVMDKHFVKVDGSTRARKVNVKHLEPIGTTADPKNAKKALA